MAYEDMPVRSGVGVRVGDQRQWCWAYDDAGSQ